MEWLSELLKHLTVSRPVAGAVLLTSSTLLLGPKLAPAYFEPLPKEWSIAFTSALLFSGALLVFWFVPVLYRAGITAVLWFPRRIRSRNLSVNEKALVLMLAKRADESLDLRGLDYASGYLSKLEVLALSSSLSRKGLVSINPYEENLIALSAEGRKRALELKVQSSQSDGW